MNVGLHASEGAVLLTLARAAIGDRLFDDGSLATARTAVTMTTALAAPRACFVTLYIPGRTGALALRGCCGSTESHHPALDAVVTSAIEAAFSDARFPKITRDEYPGLVIVVSVLTPIVPVPRPDRVTVGTDGVVLECDGRRSLFLPEVATEQGWARIELLEHLSRKAGLPADAWRRARLSTFQSERFGEGLGGAARIRRS